MKALLLVCTGLFFAGISIIEKEKKLCSCFLLIYMFVVFTCCIGGSPDLLNYENRYVAGLPGLSMGFDFLMRAGKFISLNFLGFKALIAIIYLIILYKAVKRCTEYVPIVLGLVILFPFPTAVAQMRNALMSAIVCAVLINFVLDEKHSIVKYCIGIAVATLVHASAIVYFLFVLVKVDYKKNRKMIYAAIGFTLIIEYIIVSNAVFNTACKFITDERVLAYLDFKLLMGNTLDTALNWKGKLVPVMGHVLGFIIFNYIYKRFRRCLKRAGQDESTDFKENLKRCYFTVEQLDMIYGFFALIFVVSPLYLLNPTYFRLFKNIVPLLYIVGTQYYSYSLRNHKDRAKAGRGVASIYIGAVMATLVTAGAQGFFWETLNSFSLFGG